MPSTPSHSLSRNGKIQPTAAQTCRLIGNIIYIRQNGAIFRKELTRYLHIHFIRNAHIVSLFRNRIDKGVACFRIRKSDQIGNVDERVGRELLAVCRILI